MFLVGFVDNWLEVMGKVVIVFENGIDVYCEIKLWSVFGVYIFVKKFVFKE